MTGFLHFGLLFGLQRLFIDFRYMIIVVRNCPSISGYVCFSCVPVAT